MSSSQCFLYCRDQESYNRLEEERRKMWIPRFETANEKEQRVRNERERAEFGPIAVEFRLSTPDPRYIQSSSMESTIPIYI